MKKTLILFSILFLASCTTLEIENSPKQISDSENKTNVSFEKKSLPPGKLLLENYSKQKIKSKNGDLVLAPEKPSLQKFYKNDKSPLVYNFHKIVKSDIGNSLVQDNLGEEFEVENALILETDQDLSFQKGDIILTMYKQTKGFTYGFVVDSKIEDSQMMKFFHKNLQGKTEIIDKKFTIKINGDFIKGAPLIIKDGEKYYKEILICDCNGFVLTLSENGVLNSRNKLHAVPLSVLNNFKTGDDVFVCINGSYIPAMISQIENEGMEYKLLYKENGKNIEGKFSFMEITKNLE